MSIESLKSSLKGICAPVMMTVFLRERKNELIVGAGGSDEFDSPQVLEKKAESTSGVCHRVGSVQEHERVEEVVVALDIARNLDPVTELNLARVDEDVVFVNHVAVEIRLVPRRAGRFEQRTGSSCPGHFEA